MSQQGVNVEEL